MNKLLKKFKKDGFVIVELGHKNKLNQLRKKFILNFDRIFNTLKQKRIKNDKDLIVEEKRKNRNLFVSVYNLLHLDPTIYQISSSRKILDIVKQLNIKVPHHGTRPYVRVDFPNDKKHSFDIHQDFPYNNHSLNSLVVWIPLQNTGIEEGCLRVSKYSHARMKIFKTDKNLIIKKKNFKLENIKVKLGQALIFSEFLVHSSGNNTSDKIRFSLQLRFTDLSSKEYMLRGYPVKR
jgi:phytanoyl-CoA hydroxylase